VLLAYARQNMTRIVFEQPDGSRLEVDAEPGMTVMKVAVAHDVPGIVAECGGGAACATCHVYVSSGPAELLPPIAEPEEQMLPFAVAEQRPSSRLSCQLVVPETDEVFVFNIPDRQT
jgi:2Fe-2S ferredoxin